MRHSLSARLSCYALLQSVVIACAPGADDGHRFSAVPATLDIPENNLLAPARYQLVEKSRVGGATDDGSIALVDVSDIVLTESGTTLIADGGASRVVVLDSSGAKVRTVGRAGTGPGEFTPGTPLHVALSGDTIFVIEARLHAFRLDGVHIWTEQLQLSSGLRYRQILDFAHTEHGLVVARMGDRPSLEGNGAIVDTIRIRRFRTTLTSSGDSVLTIQGATHFKVGRQYVSAFFANRPSFAIAQSGHVYYAPGIQYEIAILSFGGRSPGLVRGGVKAPTVSAEEADSARRIAMAFAENVDRQNAQAGAVAAVRASPVAPRKPLLGRLVAGDDDWLLVERRSQALALDVRSIPSMWDIIRVGQGIIGQFELPAGLLLMDFAVGGIAATGQATNGAPFVVLYALKPL